MTTRIEQFVLQTMEKRNRINLNCPDFRTPIPMGAADLFSNDYLSVTTNPTVRDAYLKKLVQMPLVLGSAGSRLLTGNTSTHTQFEQRMTDLFGGEGCGAPIAALFNSGYDANLAFFSTIPQKGDAIVFDELVHASIRDGMSASVCRDAGALYPFEHNSVSSFRERIQHVLKAHPNIANGKGTLFVAVETLYSMDGDFAPLRQIFDIAEELIPKGCAHLMVDEAHTSGLFGPQGRGLLFELGLQGRVHTVLHTYSKVWGMSGAIIMTSALIRKYLILYGRPIIYSTSLPHTHVCALNATFDFVTSPEGDVLRERLRKLTKYFEQIIETAFEHVPPDLLHLRKRGMPEDYPSHIFSPIFPLISHSPRSLEDFLRPHGYSVTAVPYPIVPKGEERIRTVLHSGNTEEELDTFVALVMQWVAWMQHKETESQGVIQGSVVHRPQQVQFRAML